MSIVASMYVVVYLYYFFLYFSCMNLQGTLERGFSLQVDSKESETDDRASKYETLKIDYKHEPSLWQRYKPTLKHLIPFRTEKW